MYYVRASVDTGSMVHRIEEQTKGSPPSLLELTIVYDVCHAEESGLKRTRQITVRCARQRPREENGHTRR